RPLHNVGRPITFHLSPRELTGDTLTGTAMDTRASLAAVTQILHELQGRSHEWDVLAAATVQEEVTLSGGQTIAWRTQPDIAIVLDVTYAQGNGVGEDEGFKLGGGPTLISGPNAHRRLH